MNARAEIVARYRDMAFDRLLQELEDHDSAREALDAALDMGLFSEPSVEVEPLETPCDDVHTLARLAEAEWVVNLMLLMQRHMGRLFDGLPAGDDQDLLAAKSYWLGTCALCE